MLVQIWTWQNLFLFFPSENQTRFYKQFDWLWQIIEALRKRSKEGQDKKMKNYYRARPPQCSPKSWREIAADKSAQDRMTSISSHWLITRVNQVFCLGWIIHPPVIPFVTPIPRITGIERKFCYSMSMNRQQFHQETT